MCLDHTSDDDFCKNLNKDNDNDKDVLVAMMNDIIPIKLSKHLTQWVDIWTPAKRYSNGV